MTVTQMREWFDLLQDKYGTPYYDDAHKLDFLNNAQTIYVNELFPDNEGGRVNIEFDGNVLHNVRTLLYELTPLQMNSSGDISFSTITSTLSTVSGDANAVPLKILSVELKRGQRRIPCKWLRHNDKGAFEVNYFKKPSFDNPRVLFQNNVLNFRPIDQSSSIYITVLKAPRAMSFSPVVNCELPENTHPHIVAIALQLAGIGSRDMLLSELNKQQLG